MNWEIDASARVATSVPPGYRVVWNRDANGKYFYNAYFGDTKHIDGSYDRNHCKAACEQHAAKNPSLPVDPATTQR